MSWLFNRRRLLADRERLGRWGERRGEKFLKGKDLRRLARNFSCKTGEIDIVMVAPDRTIVFVEVRTKSGEDFASPESTITPAKKAKLIAAARYFLAIHKIEDRPFRFDIVTIVLDQTGREQIRHYENAFVP